MQQIAEALAQHNYWDADAAIDPLRTLIGKIAAEDRHTKAWAVGTLAVDQLKIRNYGKGLGVLERMVRLLASPEPELSRPAAEIAADAGHSIGL